MCCAQGVWPLPGVPAWGASGGPSGGLLGALPPGPLIGPLKGPRLTGGLKAPYYWGLCPQAPFIGPLKGPRITLALEGPASYPCGGQGYIRGYLPSRALVLHVMLTLPLEGGRLTLGRVTRVLVNLCIIPARIVNPDTCPHGLLFGASQRLVFGGLCPPKAPRYPAELKIIHKVTLLVAGVT